MSGGYFQQVWAFTDMAEQLHADLDRNDVGYVPENEPGHGFEPDTVDLLRRCEAVFRFAGDLAKEADRLFSNNADEETFAEAVRPLLDQQAVALSASPERIAKAEKDGAEMFAALNETPYKSDRFAGGEIPWEMPHE